MAMRNFRLIFNAIVVLTIVTVSHAQVRTSGPTTRSGAENGVRTNGNTNVRTSTPRISTQNAQNPSVRSNTNSNQMRGNSSSVRNQPNRANAEIHSNAPSVRTNTQSRVRSNPSNNSAVRDVRVDNLPKAQNFNRSAVRVEDGKRFTSDRTIFHPNSNARLSAVRHNNNQYYLDNGYYYQMRNNRYYRVSAPVGMMMPSLPHGYMKMYIAGHQFYHYHGTYYRWVNNHYYVVEPPIGAIVGVLPMDYMKIYINGRVYYEYFGVVYQRIWYRGHRAYQVVGYLN